MSGVGGEGSGELSPFSEVVAGGSLLFLSSITISASGLIYWFIISRVLGVDSVGVISSLTSAAGLSTALVSAGLPIAALREFAARGRGALKPALITSLGIAAFSGVLAYGLSLKLGGEASNLTWFSAILASLTVASIPLAQALVGLGMFGNYFKTALTASVAKLIVGTAPLTIATTLQAPLTGYLSYPAAVIATATYYMLREPGSRRNAVRDGVIGGGALAHEVKELIKLSYSNYPFMLSTQVMTVLSVYGFAVATGRMFGTGVLYLSLMIVTVIASIAGSLLTASLSVGVRRDYDPFTNALRVGLGLTTPVAVTVSAAPAIYLMILNPELVTGALTLTILALSIPPSLAVTAAIMKLNKENNQRKLTALGLTRLATLIAGLTVGIRWGTEGVAAAYLLSNITPLPLALKHLPKTLKHLTTYWATQAMITAAVLTLLPKPTIGQSLAAATAAALITIAVGHVTGTMKISEIKQAVKLAVKAGSLS